MAKLITNEPLVVNVGNINDWKANVSAVMVTATSNLGSILSGQIPSIVIQEAQDKSELPKWSVKGDRFRIVWNSRTLYALLALLGVALILAVLIVLAWSNPAREQALFDTLLWALAATVVAFVTILVGKSIPGLSGIFGRWS